MVSGSPAFQATAARVFMRRSSPWDCPCCLTAARPARRRGVARLVVPPASSIDLSSARNASGTPLRDCADSTSGVFFAGALQPRHLLLDGFRRQRVDLDSATISGLSARPLAIGFELGAHGLVGLAGVLAGAVDQMQQHAAALDVAEEAVAEAGALVRAFDQAGNVGQHEFAAVALDHAELGMQRGEGIVGDLRLGRADRGEEGRLAGVRQADEAGIGDQLQAQPDPALLARLAGIGVARRAVGRAS